MKMQLRRYAVGAMAAGAVAGGAALALPGAEPAWRPITYGLTTNPARLLPATISTTHPVRVVSTALDASGRPVVTVHTATDRTKATELVEAGQQTRNAVGVELDAVMHAADVPAGTDPYRSTQWDFNKVRVAGAWPKSTGAGVTVAVIDTGVDASHPDLAGQVLSGYDVINDTEGTSTDPNGHGTHVAGTIAALTGNGVGVSAVAPDAAILPIRVLGADGSGYMSDAATGILYAADHGADVINMSLGTDTQVDAVTNAIAYARSKGVVVVAAAGNERAKGSPVSYPGADPGVIAVAATDSSDTVATYSNQGSYVDVAAPGSSIVSTYPGGGYRTLSGTSMASPHVAAVAALVKAAQPGLTPDQVEQAIESTATDLGTAGKDTDSGYGRIDATAAVAAASPATTAPTSSPASSSPASSSPTPSSPTPSSPAPTVSETSTATPSESATDPALVTPSVTLNATARLVKYRSTPTVQFTVDTDGEPMAQQPVSVCVSVNQGAFGCTAATTADDGTVTWPQRATAPFRIRLVVPATDITTAVTSATATYKVQAAATATRAGARALSVAIGGVDGQIVQVQRLDGTSWATVKTFRAAARTTVTGLTAKKRYRVVMPGTSLFAGTTSGTAQL